MEELYALIKQKIKDAGFPREIDGKEFYDDMNEEAGKQENGTYLFMLQKNEDIMYEGCMEIMDEQFDLHYVDIHLGDEKYHVDFDS